MKANGKPKYAFVILSGILIALGLSIIIEPKINPVSLMAVLPYFSVALGVILLIAFFKLKSLFFSYEMLVRSFVFFAFGVFFFLFPAQAVSVTMTMVITLFISEGAICFVVGISYMLSKQKFWIVAMLASLLSAGMASWFIGNQNLWIYSLVDMVGLSVAIFGAISLIRFILYYRSAYLNFMQPALPSLDGLSIAQIMLNTIKKDLLSEGLNHDKYLSRQDVDTYRPQVEILIHLSDKGRNTLGHVDLVIDGRIYAYGNYDKSDTGMHLLGMFFDGILAVCERQQYIRFFLERTSKSIVSYELAFDEKDIGIIRENIKNFLAACGRYTPEDIPKNKYINTLRGFDGDIYRVTGGRFKTYFVLNANCSSFPVILLRGTRLHKIQADGWTLVPGSIISFCESQLTIAGSPVVSRNIFLCDKLIKKILTSQ